MIETPGFDPYEVLGVGPDADEIVIQLAYKVRIREAHPDIAGSAGLEQTKRLNVARDWLLDPERRALLRAPRPVRSTPEAEATPRRAPRARHVDLDHLGRHTAEIHAFLHSIATLSPDERARVNYSLGDSPPPALELYREYLGPELWARSQALRDEVERVWERTVDEPSPNLPRLGRLLPTGLLVANLYAQWILLEEFFREALAGLMVRGVRVADSLAMRCTAPWLGSVGHPRYGPRQSEVMDFFLAAGDLPIDAAERLARSWRANMGRDGRGHRSEHIGPGVWLPSPPNVPEVYKISGYLAAVDASRIAPPPELDDWLRPAFHYGLRLTAYVSATGLLGEPGRDYVQPWRDAVMPDAGQRAQPGPGRLAG
ncbi:MAG: DnaJ domain-containing protein [Candidatus Limnocylindrales bacterium]